MQLLINVHSNPPTVCRKTAASVSRLLSISLFCDIIYIIPEDANGQSGGSRVYQITMDKAKNRLTIILGGSISKIEGEMVNREIVTAVNQLQRGFSVITDISTYESADKKNEELLKQSMKFLKLRGVSNIVRVVGGSKVGLLKFAQITRDIKDYSVQYVATMEAAVELLDS